MDLPPDLPFFDDEDEADWEGPEGLDPLEIESRLLALGERIRRDPESALQHPGQQELPEWRGADVIVTSDPLFEPQDCMEATKLLVRTAHARPLTWLFMELWDSFTGHLDFSNKCGFYGDLAHAALEVLARDQPDPECRKILHAVLGRAFQHLEHLHAEGCLPPQAPLILHAMNAEGQQLRIDLATGEPTA